MSSKRKLVCLLCIAFVALFSIVIISEQLIARHLSRQNLIPELTILQLEDWMTEKEPFLTPKSGPVVHENGFSIVENGIFWAKELENRIAPGPNDAQVQMQMQELRQRKVRQIQKPDWLHCGRDKNRLVHFSDESSACARFRSNHAEFVQGEIMAFYLARLLGITHTPSVILSQVSL